MNFSERINLQNRTPLRQCRRLNRQIAQKFNSSWDKQRENTLRKQLNTDESHCAFETLKLQGNPGAHSLASSVYHSICHNIIPSAELSDRIRNAEGMSGQGYRSFINRLVGESNVAKYLEVGSFKGSTLIAALDGNSCSAICIDNWSQFDGNKNEFLGNIAYLRDENTIYVHEVDFRTFDYHAIEGVDVYLFDGPHSYQDQYDGVTLAQPALSDAYVLIVDDWNWPQVRQGTFAALADIDATIMFSAEIRTSTDDQHAIRKRGDSEWHNGYFIGCIKKRPEVS